MKETIYIYDIEVFKNFFSLLMISEDGSDEYVFIKFNEDNKDDILAMIQFLKSIPNLTMVSFNGENYDEVILRCLLEKPEITHKQIYNISQAIISAKKKSELQGGLKDIACAKSPWGTIDILKILEVNLNRPSLKHCSIHLEHDWLQDLPLPFDRPIKKSDIKDIIRYNRNDVEILRKLYLLPDIQEALSMRIALGKTYNVDLRSAGDSKIANVIIESKFGIPSVRCTERPIIYGKDLIPSTLNFTTKEMLAAQKHIEDLVIIKESEDDSFTHTFNFNAVDFIIGLGGLHSDDPARKIIPKDDEFLRDADVASYYPSLILKYGLVPEHLDKEYFLEVYRGMVEERLEAKRSGDYIKNLALKLVINSLFGKMGFEFYFLYDMLSFYKVTLYGQLLLLDLIEKLYLSGINCISANTDGIVARFDKKDEDIYNEVCKEWQERTGMELEFTNYVKFVELNVNSYWTITDSGKIKVKKDFDDNKSLKKTSFIRGYGSPIIALALQAYFKDDIPPEKFIKEYIKTHGQNGIHCFFYTQRAGQKFSLFLREGNTETKLQKTNRYFVANSGGTLVKKDQTVVKKSGGITGSFTNKRETNILRGKFVRVLNNIPEGEPVYDINFDWYISKVQEIINKIEHKEEKNKLVSIFDL